MRWPRASIGWALCASALLHFGGVVALSDVERARPLPRSDTARGFVTDFEPIFRGPETGSTPRPTVEKVVVSPGGKRVTGALDQQAPEGRGGEQATREPSALLFSFVSPLTLQDTELNNLAENQVQRIRTSRERSTLEQRRASPNPADAVLLVSGQGGHQERRQQARRDAAEGAPRKLEASAASELAPALEGSGERIAQSARVAAQRKPAQGIARGVGHTSTRAAKVTFARPNVDRGRAATPAEQLDPSVRDDVDAELLAAKLQRSFVDTSVQRAQLEGAGHGGNALDPRALGTRGQGSGAQARPYAPGSGSFDVLDTSDARYLRWFTQQRARVQEELVFPRARAIAKDQGTSLYRVELRRDGGLSGAPRLIRSSGFPDFDKAAAVAIERALPFAPLPAELAPALTRIGLLIPVAFSNPMVE